MHIGPVTLEGRHVRLEPMRLAHVPALWRAGAYEELWRYLPYAVHSEDEMRAYVEERVRSGRYGNTSEYFRDLVRADQDRQHDAALEAMLLERLNDGQKLEAVTPQLFETARKRLRALADRKKSNDR